jgi:hypothetical protein
MRLSKKERIKWLLELEEEYPMPREMMVLWINMLKDNDQGCPVDRYDKKNNYNNSKYYDVKVGHYAFLRYKMNVFKRRRLIKGLEKILNL